LKKTVPVLLALLAIGCASEPQQPPSEAEAVRRALDDVRDVFATRVRGDGETRPDLDVVIVTAEGIAWRARGDDGAPVERRLVFGDVENVEHQSKDDLPSRAESLYLMLARGSSSIATSDPVLPTVVADAGIVRGYVELRDRPRGSRARLVRALEVLEAVRGRRRAAQTAPNAPAVAATTAPVASPAPTAAAITSEELERELRALERMHRDQLIDDATYARKRKELLARY
jgi:hypothetical protein